jgi:hypothetical protein
MKEHRLLQADVPSCRFGPFLKSAGHLDGKHIERAERGMQPGFGNMQVPGRSRDRDGRAGAERCADRCRHRAGAWQASGAAR